MRKSVKYIIALLLITSISYSQNDWYWLNPLPTGNDINAVSIISPDKVIVAGDAGTILESSMSNNSASNWIFRQSVLSVDHSIKSVKFIDSQNGIIAGGSDIAGGSGFILYSSNGGIDWINSYNANGILYKIFIFDPTLQFAVGNNYFLKSQNKGVTWINIPIPAGMYIRGIHFINSTTGIVAGYRTISAPPPIYYYTQSLLLRTTTGGNSWIIDSLGNGFQLNDMIFVNNNKGFIVSSSNKLFKTTNSGINWINETLNENNVTSIECLDTNRIFLTSVSGKVIRTTNGGTNWLYQNISNLSLNGISLDSNGVGYATGEKGNIYKTINYGSNWVSVTTGSLPLYDSHIFYGIYFIDENTGTAVGTTSNGCIYHTTNGGINWVMQVDNNCPTSQMRDVFFTNVLTGFIVGSGIQKTTNAGINWFYVDNVTPGLQKVYFTNDQTGFTLGGPRILKTTNSGNNWIFKFQSMGMFLHDIDFSGDKAFAVGESTIVLFSSDQGETWTVKNTGLTGNLYFNGVSMINDSTVIIADKNGKLIKSTNSGSNWRTVFSNSIHVLNSIYFSDANNGIVACNKGVILKTTNAGENWIVVQTNCKSDLLKCSKRGENNFVAAGKDLSIISTSQAGVIGIQTASTEIPGYFILKQNYPNPFNPQTKIKFDVPKASFTKLIIYDLLGREVATLVNEELRPGTYEADWDASSFSSGVYFYKIVSGEFTETKKMVLMK